MLVMKLIRIQISNKLITHMSQSNKNLKISRSKNLKMKRIRFYSNFNKTLLIDPRKKAAGKSKRFQLRERLFLNFHQLNLATRMNNLSLKVKSMTNSPKIRNFKHMNHLKKSFNCHQFYKFPIRLRKQWTHLRMKIISLTKSTTLKKICKNGKDSTHKKRY